MPNPAYTFRFSDSTNAHLDFLCSQLGMTRTAFIVGLIENEYDKFVGNPELVKLVSQMKELESKISDYMTGSSKAAQ